MWWIQVQYSSTVAISRCTVKTTTVNKMLPTCQTYHIRTCMFTLGQHLLRETLTVVSYSVAAACTMPVQRKQSLLLSSLDKGC